MQEAAPAGKPALRVGGFEPASEPLRIGAHEGNYFRVVLRALGLRRCKRLDPDTIKTLQARLRGLAGHGLLNQFGYQRFGSGLVPTDALGRAIARGHVRAFYALLCVNDYYVRRGLDGLEIEAGNSEAVVNKIQALGKNSGDEEALKTVLEVAERVRAQFGKTGEPAGLGGVFAALKNVESDVSVLPESELVRALSAGLPAGVRTLYFHAFQSRVFNAFCDEVRARVDAGGPLVVEGDLLMDGGELREARGEPGEERFLAFPLVGYRTLDEL